MIDLGMTNTALERARQHVKNVCSQGSTIYLIRPGTKDEFGTIISDEDSVDLQAFPIRFTPYDRDVLQKISWAENTDILCYISKIAFEEYGLTIQEARRFKSLRYDGKTYDIRYVELYSAFANDFLWIIIGGKK